MRKLYPLLVAATFALTSALGCGYKSIDNLLEFYVKGDKALKKLKEKGVEVKSRKEALEQEGYSINFDVDTARWTAPRLPPKMLITCNYGNDQHIKIKTDEKGMSLTKAANVGGWGGTNLYYHQFLDFGESVLDWQSSWNLVVIEMGEGKNPPEERGEGFGDFCKHAMARIYRWIFNSPEFYCVASYDVKSFTREENTGKAAQALLFLQDLEDMVCRR